MLLVTCRCVQVLRAAADLCAHAGGAGISEKGASSASNRDVEMAMTALVRQLKGRRSLDIGDDVSPDSRCSSCVLDKLKFQTFCFCT